MNDTKEKHATFTPGPWEKATIGIGTNSKQVVWLGENTGKQVQVIGTGRDHANARLIAAAPEMYEICKLLLPVMQSIANDGHRYSGESRRGEHADKLREVLAKVEGSKG